MKSKKYVFIKNEDMDPRLREDEEMVNFNISGFAKLFSNDRGLKATAFNNDSPFIPGFKKPEFSGQENKEIKQKLFQNFSMLISSKTIIPTHLKSIQTITTHSHVNNFAPYNSSPALTSPSPHPRAGGDPCLQLFFSLFIIILLINHNAHAMLLDENAPAGSLEHAEKILNKRKKSISSMSSEMVEFNFAQYPLKDLINDFAQKLNINVLYPETETVTATVTFDAGKKITMSEAWDFVTMIIEQAGYTLVMRGTTSYVLMANSKSYQEPLPLYIGVDFNQLPDTMQRIRYIYYFNNIQISAVKAKSDITNIVTTMLPSQDFKDKQFMIDDTSNSIILTTRADLIKTAMQLISVLDETGFQQAVELFKLEHTQAPDIVKLFKDVLSGGGDAKKAGGFVNLASGARAKYFSDNVRVENLDPENKRQLNTIIIIGKKNDIDEIKKFIKKYLDIAQEDGNSFFHVIEPQYASSAHLASLLNNLIQAGGSGSGQSTGSLNSELGFDPYIKIVSETVNAGPTASSSGSTPTLQNTLQRGANKLVIACNTRDWQRIESLIKQLDIPQKQVVIEALIVDLNLEFIRKLGAQIRTRGLVSTIFPKNMQAQAGLLINNVIAPQNPSDPDYYSLVGDLSDILNPDFSNTTLTSPNTSNTINSTTPTGNGPAGFTGSTIMMLNGGKATTNGVWAFFQMLSQHKASKVFTRPVVLVMNNQSVTVTSSITKNLTGTVTSGTNPTVNYQQVTAPITLTFTPLISDNNAINLQINLDLRTWITPNDASSGEQILRKLTTNASMKSGDVIILGGLTKDQTQVSKRSVPFFESIPVIGNLFASRTKDSTKTQLFILIRSTVSAPRINGSMSKITQSAANFIIDQLAEVESNFANLKDPVTRWFFHSDRDETASEFLEDKINDLQKNDYDDSNAIFEAANTGQAVNKANRHDEMKIGWFSDQKSNKNFASQPNTDDSSAQDMDKLSQLLKDMQNPFTSYTQL
jgi:general secretion pathway protein D